MPATIDAPTPSPDVPIAAFAYVSRGQQVFTASLVVAPFIALAVVFSTLWGRAINLTDVTMMAVLYLIAGFGITIGFHRLFSHKSFTASRALKISLAIAGSLAFEGAVNGWVATHRRHHRFSDRPGDPHSPHRFKSDGKNNALLRGLFFAHVGWLFVSDPTSSERYAPDLLGDPDMVTISKLFPLIGVGSLAIPFGVGYLIGGTLTAAILGFVWGGLVRMALLHHMTWGVNSLCHAFGKRDFETTDLSTNISVLAIPSLGDSWHNTHHAHPAWARHGSQPGQLDISAIAIRLFEKLGWATRVRWPSASEATASS